jgi:hypothetical protein
MISASALVLGAALATTAAAQVAHPTDGAQWLSNNTLTDVGNDKSTTTKTKTLTDVGNDKSTNTKTTTLTDVGNDKSVNTKTETETTTITASLSLQDLDATVTGNTVNGGAGATDGLHPTGAGIVTGAISADGASYSNFAGVQTATNNTGLQSVNQAATGLAANANISFGAP